MKQVMLERLLQELTSALANDLWIRKLEKKGGGSQLIGEKFVFDLEFSYE